MSKPVLSLSAFADWCEKPENVKRSYNFYATHHCACDQYLEFIGIGWPLHGEPGRDFIRKANRLAACHPRTFSALAARLRSAS